MNQFYEGKNIFYVAKSEDLGDKINYETLSGDDVYEYVENLYKKYAMLNDTNSTTNTKRNTNTQNSTNSKKQ